MRQMAVPIGPKIATAIFRGTALLPKNVAVAQAWADGRAMLGLPANKKTFGRGMVSRHLGMAVLASGLLTAQAYQGSSPVAGTYSYSINAAAVTSSTLLPAGNYTLTVNFTPSVLAASG